MTLPEQRTVMIRFEGKSPAAATIAAEELRRKLQKSVGDSAAINIQKDRGDTQDFGATLVLVLGTPAALALAKGIHDFIAKWGDRVTIKTPEGQIIATGDGAKNINVSEAAEALRGK